jgi:predicted acylesterase/phospholipase RssA
MSQSAGRTHALVLAGGGAYGAYEAGVAQALVTGASPSTDRQPLVPRIVAGTSAGAFNAALFVSAAERGLAAAVDHLTRTWLHDVAGDDGCGNGVFRFRLDATRLVDPRCFEADRALPFVQFAEDAMLLANDLARRALNMCAPDGTIEQRLLELIDVSVLVSTEPFSRVIRRDVAPDSIRRSDHVLQIAATNWKTGALRIFSNDDFSDDKAAGIIRAATAIPGLFPSVDVDGEPYVDASFVLNTPLKQPIDAGADVLHVVYFNPDVDTVPLPRLRNTVSTLNRAVLITLGAMVNRDIEIASRVNLALDVLGKSGGATSAAEARALVHEAGSRRAAGGEASSSHRRVEIHRYHAREPIGPTFRWLSFERDHLERLMAHGFEDAAHHDCRVSRCILAD